MGPRPYSERSSLPSDNPISAEIVPPQAIPETPSPSTLSAATTPSPVPQDNSTSESVSVGDEEVIDVLATSPFFPAPGDGMPYDHALPGFLRQITNQSNLTSLHSLSIRVMSRMTSLSRMSFYTPNLRELNLEGSMLGSLRDIGCNLKYLQVLKVGRCHLDSLDGTFGLSSLRELYAEKNMVTDVTACANLPHIRHIDVSMNHIRSLSSAGFLTMCPKLRSVVLEGNPGTSVSNYREHLHNLLPRLESLDNIPFLNEENNAEMNLIENFADTSDTSSVDWNDYGLTPRSSDEVDDHGEEEAENEEENDKEWFEEDVDEVEKVLSQDDIGRLQHIFDDLSFDDVTVPSPEEILEKMKMIESKSTSYSQRQGCTKFDKDIDNISKKRNVSLEAGPSSTTGALFEKFEEIPTERNLKNEPSASSAEKSDRPSTASGSFIRRDGSSSSKRPSTASELHRPLNSAENRPAALNLEPGVSKLTSGAPVCGNLTAALRHRMKQHNKAWEEDSLQPRKIEPLILLPKESGSGDCPDQHEPLSTDADIVGEDVLVASKKWREAFRRFRSNNRARWEEEDNMDYHDLLGKPTQEETTLSDSPTHEN